MYLIIAGVFIALAVAVAIQVRRAILFGRNLSED